MLRRSFLSAPFAQASRSRPNVVIILADDLGSADVGYRGSEIQTPNIDRLAAGGVQFERFYACPLCSPTRASLMTARYPIRYGIQFEVIKAFTPIGVPPEERMMPEAFRGAGYQTAIVGKWHLGHARQSYLPNARGFDYSYGFLNGALDYYKHEFEGGYDWHRNGKTVREEGYSTDLLAADAVRVIEAREKARPLFLYLPFNAPHGPLQAPPGLIEKYGAIQNKGRRTYAAMVDALDTAVGKVLAALDREGIGENTLVLFLSDNGGLTPGGASNRPFRDMKASTFEGGIRVPAVARWPGRIKAGTKSSQVMTVLDVFPTLAAAAGIKPGDRLPLDGRNLWPAIEKGRVEPREDLYFGVESRKGLRLAVLRREWKYVRDGASEYLFNVEEDPGESSDMGAMHPQMLKELARKAEEWRAVYPLHGTHASDAAPAGWRAPAQWAEAAQPD